jgi:hypothetical protein
MLEHYLGLGVDSLIVNAHVRDSEDPALEQIRGITDQLGCGIASVTVGPWLQEVNPTIYERSRQEHPNEWFLLADQDELQVYPGDLREIIERCEAAGYDYIEGCFIDRLATEGRFPPVHPRRSIWEQFPLGGFLSTPILDANPNKIVAAKGHVKLMPGQHAALSGRGCPVEECYVQVHHFKWVEGIVERLERRVAFYRDNQDPLWQESARFVEYARAHAGRIDISDPLFYIAECSPAYPFWDTVKRLSQRTAMERLPAPLRRAAASSE